MGRPTGKTARHVTAALTMDQTAAVPLYSTIGHMAATFGMGALRHPLRPDPRSPCCRAAPPLAGLILLGPAARIANTRLRQLFSGTANGARRLAEAAAPVLPCERTP